MAYETTATLRQSDAVDNSASIARIIVAIIIDFLLFSALVSFALYFYGLSVHGLAAASGPVAMKVQAEIGFLPNLAAFAVFESIIFFALKFSPGRFLLSIGPDYSVDPRIFGRDSALTILLSMATLYGGISQITDCMVYAFPTPIFGFYPGLGPLYDTVLKCIIGVFWAVAGFMLFKLSRLALAAVIVGTIVEVISIVLSSKLWQEAAPMLLIGRQSALGGTLSNAPLEFARDNFPLMLIGVSAVYFLLVLAATPRFLSGPQPTPP